MKLNMIKWLEKMRREYHIIDEELDRTELFRFI